MNDAIYSTTGRFDLFNVSIMEDNKDKGFSAWHIAGHLIVVLLLSCVAIFFIKKETEVSASDYISGVGSVASVYAILIALWQIWQTKTAAQAAAKAAKEKSKEIDKFLSFANINRHIEISNSILQYLSSKQYEAAIIKMDQLKELLIELKENKLIDNDDWKTAHMSIIKLGTDVLSLRKELSGYNCLDKDVVISHVSNINTFLQEISAKLKRKNYDKGEV